MRLYSYILVRRDLAPSVQAVQAVHAAMEMGFRSKIPLTPTNVVLLGVKDLDELMQYSERLVVKDIGYELFYEPDYGTGWTALCTYPVEGKVTELSELKLL